MSFNPEKTEHERKQRIEKWLNPKTSMQSGILLTETQMTRFRAEYDSANQLAINFARRSVLQQLESDILETSNRNYCQTKEI